MAYIIERMYTDTVPFLQPRSTETGHDFADDAPGLVAGCWIRGVRRVNVGLVSHRIDIRYQIRKKDRSHVSNRNATRALLVVAR